MGSRKSSADHFDLLPFIAILMCTLGTLLLVTLSMAAVNLGVGAGETWIPSEDSTRTTKIPVLFEWDGNTLVVDLEKGRVKIDIPFEQYIQAPDNSAEEKAAKAKVDEGIAKLNADVLADLARNNTTHYALIAIRPSGFHSFGGELRALFEDRDISIGTEPIAQGKPVKLLGKAHQP